MSGKGLSPSLWNKCCLFNPSKIRIVYQCPRAIWLFFDLLTIVSGLKSGPLWDFSQIQKVRTWCQFFEKVLSHLFAPSPSKRVEACCHLDFDLTIWPGGPHKMLSIGAWHGMQLKDPLVILFLLQGLQEFILAVFRQCTLHGTKHISLGEKENHL